ncbi:MAG: hydroxymethylglutaryl-CoA lyase [Deltaproteobacteria bacterium]|nr:hydroxymethylglutaryl-CoA lyase [Deltaproteobacteria bacterium]
MGARQRAPAGRCVTAPAAGERVAVVEVGPRDGLQNESTLVETEAKIVMIEGLVDAGITRIEVTSFVNPRWIPPLADQADVARGIQRRAGVEYSALVPNLKGYENAAAAGMRAVALVVSASETHNRKNINAGVEDTLTRYAEVADRARREGVKLRGYVSTAFGCPYEGPVPVPRVVAVAERLLALGAHEVSLGDTIGVASPRQVGEMLQAVQAAVPLDRIALHLHDTRGTALANALAGLEAGVRVFDSSVGGMGGCPYAPGAAGNLATEDLVWMLQGMGLQTGIDVDKVAEVARAMGRLLGRVLPGKYSQAGPWQARPPAP